MNEGNSERLAKKYKSITEESKGMDWSKKKVLTTLAIGLLTAAAATSVAYDGVKETFGVKDIGRIEGGSVLLLPPNSVWNVPANSIVTGDIVVKMNGEWVRLYDDDPRTTHQVKVLEETEIEVPYGAAVSPRLDPEIIDTVLEKNKKAVLEANPEIKEMITVTIPNTSTQGKQ